MCRSGFGDTNKVKDKYGMQGIYAQEMVRGIEWCDLQWYIDVLYVSSHLVTIVRLKITMACKVSMNVELYADVNSDILQQLRPGISVRVRECVMRY